MHVDAATQTRSADAELGPGFRETLPPVVAGDIPALVVGETPEVVREHEWPGSLFFMLGYLSTAALAIGACVSGGAAALGWGRAPLEMLGQAVAMGAGAAIQWRVASGVEHFSRWGWYGAMAELVLASAAKVWAMTQGNWIGGAIGLGIDLLWMSYFWERREQFDVDLEL